MTRIYSCSANHHYTRIDYWRKRGGGWWEGWGEGERQRILHVQSAEIIRRKRAYVRTGVYSVRTRYIISLHILLFILYLYIQCARRKISRSCSGGDATDAPWERVENDKVDFLKSVKSKIKRIRKEKTVSAPPSVFESLGHRRRGNKYAHTYL